MFRAFRLLVLPLLACLCLGSCAMMKRLTPDFSKIPKPPLPNFSTLKKITRIIPGMPESDQANSEDPRVPFNARGTLGYGHTLRLQVYEGARAPQRIFNGVVMIDEKGMVTLGQAGSTRIGGSTLPKAAEAIAATFRVGMNIGRSVTVHILSVEDTPMVSIRGDVISDEFIPTWDDMTVEQAVRVAGSRKIGSTNHGVYLIREGLRRFYPSLAQANEVEPEPGDIIELSPDI